MQTASVREIQHNLARVLREVENGEEYRVLRRNRPVARIVPIISHEDASEFPGTDWSGHWEETLRIFGRKPLPGRPMDRLVSDGRGDR